MSLATREDWLAATGRRYATIPVPALGKDVRIRTLTDGEWEAFDAEENSDNDEERAARQADKRRRLVALIVVDDAGNPVLKPTDVRALEKIDAGATTYVANAGMVLGGYRRVPDAGVLKNSASSPDSEPVSS